MRRANKYPAERNDLYTSVINLLCVVSVRYNGQWNKNWFVFCPTLNTPKYDHRLSSHDYVIKMGHNTGIHCLPKARRHTHTHTKFTHIALMSVRVHSTAGDPHNDYRPRYLKSQIAAPESIAKAYYNMNILNRTRASQECSSLPSCICICIRNK
jgi:hypothetical protein